MSQSQHTVSPAQLAANHANAARSTGPKTPEGKARSSQNARKHLFTASTFAVVRLEDLQEVARLKDDLVALYQPVNSQELFALERMALAQHAILRGARLESGFFTTCLNEPGEDDGGTIRPMNPDLIADIEITKAQNRSYVLGAGFHQLARQSASFSLLLRYQAHAERQYRRALEEFDRLKALREILANEPIFEGVLETQPEQKEPLYTPFQTDPFPSEDPAPAPAPPAIDPPTEPNSDPATDSVVLEARVPQPLAPGPRPLAPASEASLPPSPAPGPLNPFPATLGLQ